MRKIKASTSYLKNQVRKNLAKATLSALIFGAVLSTLMFRILTTFQIGFLEQAGLVFLLVPVVACYFYLRKYHVYSGGWQGEKQVAQQLSNKLSDDYYLINDLYLHSGGGDIDHLILAPNGVFVLETKNWNGKISCNGNEWQRAGKRDFNSSPSRQVKRNAAKISQIIDSSPNLRGLNVWVEEIVVFTNKHASLSLHNPSVAVVTLQQLPSHITQYKSVNRYSREQLELIGKEIVKQKQ